MAMELASIAGMKMRRALMSPHITRVDMCIERGHHISLAMHSSRAAESVAKESGLIASRSSLMTGRFGFRWWSYGCGFEKAVSQLKR